MATSDLSVSLEAALGADSIQFSLGVVVRSGVPPTPYQIEPDEHLIATFQGSEVELAGGEGTYRGSIGVDQLAGDEEIAIVIDRADLGSTRIASRVPTPFVVVAPAPQPATEEVVITWSPIANDQRIRWLGEGCTLARLDGPIPEDTGILTIPPGVLARTPIASDCRVDLAFVRERSTRLLDTDFADGSFTVSLAHTISFRLIP